MSCKFDEPKNIPFYLILTGLLFFAASKGLGSIENAKNLFTGVAAVMASITGMMAFSIAYRKFILDERLADNKAEDKMWEGPMRDVSIEKLKAEIRELHRQGNIERMKELAIDHFFKLGRLKPPEVEETFRRAIKSSDYEIVSSKNLPQTSSQWEKIAKEVINDAKDRWHQKQRGN